MEKASGNETGEKRLRYNDFLLDEESGLIWDVKGEDYRCPVMTLLEQAELKALLLAFVRRVSEGHGTPEEVEALPAVANCLVTNFNQFVKCKPSTF